MKSKAMEETHTKTHILLLCGGGGSEHDISIISANYIHENLLKISQKWNELEIHFVELQKDGVRKNRETQETCELRKSGEIFYHDKKQSFQLSYVIPCIHGPPGETGEIQALFEMMRLPYFGPGPEASITCFNKVSTKLWFNSLGIPNTPFEYVYSNDTESINKVFNVYTKWKGAFIKATHQGSSIGCHLMKYDASIGDSQVKDKIKSVLDELFTLSPYILIEQPLKARELEIAAYEIDGILNVTPPGEIITPNGFYTFEEKYAGESKTKTETIAKDLNQEQIQKMKNMAIKAFKALKLKDLSRIDFFLTQSGEIYLNEINTFPGMTPISMFPKMLQANGQEFDQYLEKAIRFALNR